MQEREQHMDDQTSLAKVEPSGAHLPSTEVREPIPEFDQSVDIRDYIDIVLRRKWVVMTVLLVVFTTTLLVSLTMTPLFKTNGRLELSLQAPKVTKFEEVVATQLQTREFIQTQVSLLKSRSLARRVVDRLGLDDESPSNANFLLDRSEGGLIRGLVRSIKDLFPQVEATDELDEATRKIQVEQAVENAFADRLEVVPERDTTIIALSFTSRSPALAKDVVNTHIEEFINWQMDKKIASAQTAKKQLQKQIEHARIQLEKSEAALNRFAHKAGIVSLDSKLNLVYRQLEEINDALAKVEPERLSKEALYQSSRQGDLSSLPPVLSNPLIQELRAQYIDLMAQYRELRATFKDDYPSVQRIRAKMSDVQSKIGQEERRIADSIKKDYLTTLDKEQTYRTKAEERKALALELNEKATQYKILQREVETNKQIHQSLLERAKEIDASVGADIGNIQVVDYAKLPLKPYKPNVRLNLLLAIVIGLMGGVGLAFFLEYLDNTIKGIDEVADRFQIPVLGIVPLVERESPEDMYHLVRLKPNASFSESIRTARFSIQLYSSMEPPPKILLVTSTSEKQGKTTIACNLAQAFASSEEKVLIMDCDLRKPRHHKIFSNSSRGRIKGLTHFLSGNCSLKEAVHKSRIDGLYFLPVGHVPPNPAELLASRRMRETFQKLRGYFDRIIVDSPPAAGFADVLILGNQVDGIILVANLGETARQALRLFRENMYNVNGNLMGCIVNKLDRSYRYGDYYYQYYEYYENYSSYYRPKDGEAEPILLEEEVEGNEQEEEESTAPKPDANPPDNDSEDETPFNAPPEEDAPFSEADESLSGEQDLREGKAENEKGSLRKWIKRKKKKKKSPS